jgi:hypothetical protein
VPSPHPIGCLRAVLLLPPSLKRVSPSVSDTETGESGTCAWSLGGVDPSTSLAVIFDVTAKDAGGVQPGKRHHLQLITYYLHSNGRYRMRVTTTAGGWCRCVRCGQRLPELTCRGGGGPAYIMVGPTLLCHCPLRNLLPVLLCAVTRVTRQLSLLALTRKPQQWSWRASQ